MKKICLIFFAVYLTESEMARPGQTDDPADDEPFILNVRRTLVETGNKSLAVVKWDRRLNMYLHFVNDLKPGDMKLHVEAFDEYRQVKKRDNIKDACKIDPTTHKGTLTAIFFNSFGIYSCPVKAGVYKNRRELNVTGTIEDVFNEPLERFYFVYDATTQDGQKYIKITYDIEVVDGELANSSESLEKIH